MRWSLSFCSQKRGSVAPRGRKWIVTSVLFALAADTGFSGEFRLRDNETPAYVEFSQADYVAQASGSNAVVTVIRTGDFRMIASVQCVAREPNSTSNPVTHSGVIVFRAGQSVAEFVLPISNDTAAGQSGRVLYLALTNPAPNTVILRANATLAILANPDVSAIPPKLEVRMNSDSRIVISWRRWETNCILEMTDALGDPWREVIAVPASMSDQMSVQQTVTQSQRFFRLRAASPPAIGGVENSLVAQRSVPVR